MKKIICTATSFGYGPVSKLLTICKHLSNYDLIFVGSGVALELAKHENCFKNIKEIDILTEHGKELFKKEILKADLVLNVLEPESILLAKEGNIPVVYVDSLFWMWDKLPNECIEVDRYIAQSFPGVREKLKNIGAEIKNFDIVGPIIDREYISNEQKEDFIIVNLSGMESPFVKAGKNLIYPKPIIKLIVTALQNTRSENVIFTGNDKVMKEMTEKYSTTPFKFKHVSHEEFLKLLSKAKMIITSPGLTTTYEALVYNTPIRFLPPQNYSMALMLELYKEIGFADISISWNDLYENDKTKKDMPEEEGVKRVAKLIEDFSKDIKAQKKVGEVFEKMLTVQSPNIDKQIKILGEELLDGAMEIKNIIEEYIK